MRRLRYVIFVVGMLILGFANPPLQYVGLAVFYAAIAYAITEPRRRRKRRNHEATNV